MAQLNDNLFNNLFNILIDELADDVTAELKYQAAFLAAMDKKLYSVVFYMIDNNLIDVNEEIYDSTLLIYAINAKSEKLVKKILDRGIDVNQQNTSTGNSALMIACMHNNLEFIKILIDAGANLNLRNKSIRSDTALHIACRNNYIDIVKILIKAGVNINIANEKLDTALIIAAFYGYTSIVELLINAGANLNLADSNGCTALICAAKYDHDHTLKKLLEAGANIDITNNFNRTALYYACKNNLKSCVKNLIEAGANVDIIVDDENKTAMDYANDKIKKIIKTSLELRLAKNKLTCTDINGKNYSPLDPTDPVLMVYQKKHNPTIITFKINAGMTNVIIWENNTWMPKELDTNNMEIQVPKELYIKLEYHVLAPNTFIKFPADTQLLIDGKKSVLGNIYRKPY